MSRNIKKVEYEEWKTKVPYWLANLLLFATFWVIFVEFFTWLSPSIAYVVTMFLNTIGLPIFEGRTLGMRLFYALLLYILSHAIRHRRRIALYIEIIYFQFYGLVFASIVLIESTVGAPLNVSVEMASGTDLLIWMSFTVVVCLTLCVLLFKARDVFNLKARITKKGILTVTVILTTTFLIATVSGILVSLSFGVSLENAVTKIFYSVLYNFRFLVPFGQSFYMEPIINAYWAQLVMSFICLFGILVTLIFVLRPNEFSQISLKESERKIRQLLLEYGEEDTLSYYATRRDKTVLFSKNGKAALAYSRFGNILLVSGDPIGDKKSWKDVGKQFVNLAHQNGCSTGVIASTYRGAKFWNKLGLKTISFGDEAIVNISDFSLESPQLHAAAKVLRKAEREGYHVSIRRQGEISRDELQLLTEYVDKWRIGGPERGFSMASSRFGDPSDSRTVIVTAFDREGNPKGILSFVPAGEVKLSLDTMRRSPEALNGVTTLMIVKLIQECQNIGINEVSLNFAVLRGVFVKGEEITANVFERQARRTLLFFNRWYQLESLYRSNEIYNPEWRRRYLCFEHGLSTSEFLIAIGQAEGFLPRFSLIDGIKRGILFVSNSNSNSNSNDYWKDSEFIEQIQNDEEEYALELLKKQNIEFEKKTEKLIQFQDAGFSPYQTQLSEKFLPLENLTDLCRSNERIDTFDEKKMLNLVGRLINLRNRGAMSFADLQDGSSQIQLILKKNLVNEIADKEERRETFAVWKKFIKVGDLVVVKGNLMRTNTGVLSLNVVSWELMSKTIEPLEMKAQNYYHALHIRQNVERVTRHVLESWKYYEVKSSLLDSNVNGIKRAFTLNGDIFYAYEQFSTQKLQIKCVKQILSELGHSGEIKEKNIYSALSDCFSESITVETSKEILVSLFSKEDLQTLDVENLKNWELIEALYSKILKPQLTELTLFTGFPIETALRALSTRNNPKIAENWELCAPYGVIASGTINLTNPLEYRNRLSSNDLSQSEEVAYLFALEKGVLPFGEFFIHSNLVAMMKKEKG